MTITHRCGHKMKYQSTGGASALLRFLLDKSNEACSDCKEAGLQDCDLPAVFQG